MRWAHICRRLWRKAAPSCRSSAAKPVDSLSGERIDVVCPSDGLAFASIPASGKADVDRAVQAARAAFDAGPWRRMPAFERGRCLTRLGLLVEKNGTELAALESRDTGKPVRQGRADVAATMRYFEFYGGAADKIHGDTIPFLDGYTALTLARAAWRGGGHRSLELSAADPGARRRRRARDGQHAGRQAGRGRLADHHPHGRAGAGGRIPGRRVQCRHRLRPRGRRSAVRPSRCRLRHLHRLAADRHGDPAGGGGQQSRRHHGARRQVAADRLCRRRYRKAAPALVNAIIQNGGQTCSAGSRILVERPVYEAVAAELASAVFGAGRRPARCRPRPRRADQRAAEDARRGDGRRSRGGRRQGAGARQHRRTTRRPAATTSRRCCSATSIRNAATGAGRSVRPGAGAVCLRHGRARRSRWPIGTDYGLVAGIWTKDGARQHRVAKQVRAGQVFVNAYGAGGGVELPFGGFGKSGHGREKGFEALYDMSATKTIVFNHG